jgi:hypothetical protein
LPKIEKPKEEKKAEEDGETAVVFPACIHASISAKVDSGRAMASLLEGLSASC